MEDETVFTKLLSNRLGKKIKVKERNERDALTKWLLIMQRHVDLRNDG